MWRAISGYTDCPSVVVRTSGNRSFLLIQFPFPILCLIFFNCLVSCLFCFAHHDLFSFRTGSVAETIMVELVVWPKRPAPERYALACPCSDWQYSWKTEIAYFVAILVFLALLLAKTFPFVLRSFHHRLPFYIWISETTIIVISVISYHSENHFRNITLSYHGNFVPYVRYFVYTFISILPFRTISRSAHLPQDFCKIQRK